MKTLYDVTINEFKALLDDEPTFRTQQLWEGLYRKALRINEITNVPLALRRSLNNQFPYGLSPVIETTSDNGETVKWLWELHDGARIETVLMHYPERTTVCVSSQAGCAMACAFCATGQAGYERQLSVGEIVEQVIRARQSSHPRRVSNIVFMGMGEPLANYKNVWAAIERLNTHMGIGARNLTISTVGIVPGIRKLAKEQLPVNLAVSLHLAEDSRRDALVPINKQYPLAELADACHQYRVATRRSLSLEWALIHKVNDQELDAQQLAEFARPLRAHVNLIPLNPTPGYAVTGSTPKQVNWFCNRLGELGINATIRQNRGTEIDAACGQLRAENAATQVKLPTPNRNTK